MSEDTYIEVNVPLFEAIYGKGLISLGGIEAINDMFVNVELEAKTVLDVGSGIGGMAYHLAQLHHCTVVGLEIRQWMADYAIRHAPQNIKDHLKFITYKPNGIIPVDAQTMDICTSKGVLTNIEDKLSLFQELHRILKNTGQIVIIDWLVPQSAGPKSERLRLGDMSFKESATSYAQLLQKAGFKPPQFTDKSNEYLKYVQKLDNMYHSAEHKKTYANIISNELRHNLIEANNDLRQSIESGQQLSMLITANK